LDVLDIRREFTGREDLALAVKPTRIFRCMDWTEERFGLTGLLSADALYRDQQ
jgi:hypothetical protein